MLSLRDIRRKIKSVKNIQQITQAMKMVAAARLKKVQERVTSGKPYFEQMQALMSSIAASSGPTEHPLLESRPVERALVVVVAGDKGLCGSYNNNLLRFAQRFIDEYDQAPVDVLAIGNRAGSYFASRRYSVVQRFPQISVDAAYDEIQTRANAITSRYLSGEVDVVHIVSQEFISTMQQRPRVIDFLPMESPSEEDESSAEAETEFIFEPPAKELLAVLLPRYVDTMIYHLLLEALTGEFAARMTAMTSATDNAGDLIDSLTLQANKARQWSITTEILEVVGGAEALKG